MKDFWVGRMFLVTCSISKQKHPCYFQNKHQHFQKYFHNIFQTWNISKAQHFVYVLTNENYYKVCLNNGSFSKYFQKPHKAYFQTKASDLASN